MILLLRRLGHFATTALAPVSVLPLLQLDQRGASTPPAPVRLTGDDGPAVHWLLFGAVLGLAVLLFAIAVVLATRELLGQRSGAKRHEAAPPTLHAVRDPEDQDGTWT